MSSILLVEDDETFRETLAVQLRKQKYLVTEAQNGKSARDLCNLQNFELIISDMQMPFLSGTELLEWVRANKGEMPFILTTGFTHIPETHKAHELGATDFIAKPFTQNELLNTVQKILRPGEPPKAVVPQLTEQDFCKISIDEFVSRPHIEFDVFVRLSEKKYVKIGNSGDTFPAERIRSYKQKGVRHLHIRRDDFAKLVGFNLHVSKLVTKADNVNKEKKFNFIKYTSETILEKAFISGVDKGVYEDAKTILESGVSVIAENEEYIDLLNILNQHSDWVYAHCVGTSMVALMIARKMEFTLSQVFFKLGMAGLFHEIGYKEIPREIIDKPRPLLSQTERALLETHPSRAREILSELRGIPNDVIEIVYQHHEDVMGTGYPCHLNKNKIHPLAKILQVADTFCDVAIQSAHHSTTSGPRAIEYIESMYGDKLDKDALNALKSIYPDPAVKKAS